MFLPYASGTQFPEWPDRLFEDSLATRRKSGEKAVFPPVPAEHEEKFSARGAGKLCLSAEIRMICG